MGCCTSSYCLTAAAVARKHLQGRDLKGRVALITGCTSGLGIETARTLAFHGAHVVITGRNEKKLSEAEATIKKSVPSAQLTVLTVDLTSFSSIRRCARQFVSLHLPLHLLILNAGVMAIPYGVTAEGLECTFGTNHVGHFLLFNLLLPTLKSSAPSRLVVLSSRAHELGVFGRLRIGYANLPTYEDPSRYDRWACYQQSKLANLMFAYEVNRRYSKEGVHAFSVHPGVIKTELFDDVPGACCMVLGRPCLKSVPQGSATSIYCSVAEGLEEKGGEYFANSQWVEGATERVADGEFVKLWEWTENFIEKHPDEEKDDGGRKEEKKVKEREKDDIDAGRDPMTDAKENLLGKASSSYGTTSAD